MRMNQKYFCSDFVAWLTMRAPLKNIRFILKWKSMYLMFTLCGGNDVFSAPSTDIYLQYAQVSVSCLPNLQPHPALRLPLRQTPRQWAKLRGNQSLTLSASSIKNVRYLWDYFLLLSLMLILKRPISAIGDKKVRLYMSVRHHRMMSYQEKHLKEDQRGDFRM